MMAEPAAAIDLSVCDREPIHIPGAIQPHGALLAFDPDSLRVEQAAGDFAAVLGFEGEVIGADARAVLRPAADLLSAFDGRSGGGPVHLGSFAGDSDRLNPVVPGIAATG